MSEFILGLNAAGLAAGTASLYYHGASGPRGRHDKGLAYVFIVYSALIFPAWAATRMFNPNISGLEALKRVVTSLGPVGGGVAGLTVVSVVASRCLPQGACLKGLEDFFFCKSTE